MYDEYFGFRGRALRLVICLGLVLLLGFSLLWSAPQQNQEFNQPLQYNISVVLKLITVYVTDKKGNPVEDLGREDFMVTDNGQPVKLTEFEKHRLKVDETKASQREGEAATVLVPAAVPAEQAVTVQPRKFFLLFDFAFNQAKGILKAKKAAQHFLEKVVRADDEVSVLSYSMIKGLTVHEYLTKDHNKVRQVIDSIGSKDLAGRASEIEENYWLMAQESQAGGSVFNSSASVDIKNENAKERNREAERQESKRIAENYILRMTALAQALRYEPGQKHFIVFSTGIPSSMVYGNQAGNPNSLYGRSKFDAGDRVLRAENENMYKELAAANCTIYAFDTRESAREVDLFAYDRVTFEESQLHRGMFTDSGVFQDNTDVFRDEKTLGGNSLKRMTDLTGGKYFSNINFYEKNLELVQAMTGTYYVVGYYTSEIADGRFHEVKVEVKRPGCEVRSQSGYFNPKPFRDFTELEKKLHLFDLALNERSFSKLPVRFPMSCIGLQLTEGSGVKMTASVPGEITSRFEGDRVEYVTLVFDEKNDIRQMRRLETDRHLLQGKTVILTSVIPLEPGDYTCRLVIRDLATGLSAVSSAKALVPAATKSSLTLGTPFLLREEGDCTYIETKSDHNRLSRLFSEMYSFDQKVYVPLVGQISKQTRRLRALVPFNVAEESEAEVALAVRLIEATTGQTRLLYKKDKK
ncbi:MAG: VWA domain-containing protein [Candidatus Saccharicenans sp.]|nr:VWA domain-containing protein [Candidatus Saccharicenans sp.]